MSLQVDVQTACAEPVPGEADIRRWVAAALPASRRRAEVSVRLVGEAEMRRLNRDYRGRDRATNVLAFPCRPPGCGRLLGDIAVCAAVVEREARERNQPLEAHWSHMLVHASLHLLGHDHREARQAKIMEALETRILRGLGYACPYSAPAR